MADFLKNIEIRWSDLDPNFHVRHSAYYDYAASARIEFLQQNGITVNFMKDNAFGVVIFREECVFKRELVMTDKVSINMTLLKATPDYSRWSIQHTIFKNGDTISAVLNLDGSWIDIIKRKLTIPPGDVVKTFSDLPRAENFEWIIKN